MEVVVGIDEVGRGCWAGPLLAAAVILNPKQLDFNGNKWKLLDSKKMSKLQRAVADVQIRKAALSYGIGWVTPSEIDQLGLTKATQLAMRRAIDKVDIPYDRIIIDGNYNYLSDIPMTETLIQADNTIPAVSAASIIAKVARDTFMTEQAALYPEYGFDNHVGYGTKRHIKALLLYGVTPIHRKSYKPIKVFL